MGKTRIIYSKKGNKHRKYDDYEIAGFESFDKGNKKRKHKSKDFDVQKNKPKNPTIPTEIVINTAIVKQAKNLRVPMNERIIHARTIIENPTLLSPKEQKFLEHYSKFISDKNKRPFFCYGNGKNGKTYTRRGKGTSQKKCDNKSHWY